MQTTNQLRENIAKCLQDKHMTQCQLSILSGVHESTISRILSGKRDVLFSHACKLSRGFGFESVATLIHYPNQVAIIEKLL
ncbi:MAG: helix-turn-helix transcriptional regulator [Paludibacteraceae bacterium]|nr:helix-turn-helix transcriptional regulator [Paludibacteraceae bacterium]